MNQDALLTKEYFPERLSRRGEWTAWGLAVVAGAAWFLLRMQRTGAVIGLGLAVVLMLLLSAWSISLGNWMDRRTSLKLNDAGVAFTNGLRNVRLIWPDIHAVKVTKVQWGGRRVQVFGPDTHFTFYTLGKVMYRNEERGRTGFAGGQDILQTILLSAGLQLIQTDAPGYYYARE